MICIRRLISSLPIVISILFALLYYEAVISVSNASTILIEGPEQATNGSRYIVSGGCASYFLSISKGIITADGVVTVGNQCGNATIYARDACGQLATKVVRMPLGRWFQTKFEKFTDMYFDGNNYYSAECVQGKNKYYESWSSHRYGNLCLVNNVTYRSNTVCYPIAEEKKSICLPQNQANDGTYTTPCGTFPRLLCAAVYSRTTLEWRCDNEGNCKDSDNDGVYSIAADCITGTDCDDSDSTVLTGANELCDGKDNNCNGQIDELQLKDNDGDGYSIQVGGCPIDLVFDCNDNNALIYPDAPEICNDMKDNNCNGLMDESCKRDRCMELPM